jgi:hypothetical protein
LTGEIDELAASDGVMSHVATMFPAEGYGVGVHHKAKRNGPVAVPFGLVTVSALSTAFPPPIE